MEWFSAILEKSSPVFLLALLPLVFLVLIPVKRARRIPLVGLSGSGTPKKTKARWFFFLMSFSVYAAAVLVIVGSAAPPVPSFRSVVLPSKVSCAHNIVSVLDASGSMKDAFKGDQIKSFAIGEKPKYGKFDVELASLYVFAKNRPDDCFSNIVFSGPGGEGPARKAGYAFVVNYDIKNPDQLILPLRQGIEGDSSSSYLAQYAWGTRISEGLRVAEEFLDKHEKSRSPVLMLISDLGNEDTDNAKALEILNRLLNRGVSVYILGIEVYDSETSGFFGQIQPLIKSGEVEYFPINDSESLVKAYRAIDKLEPAPAPMSQVQVVSGQARNPFFFFGALGFIALWFILSWKYQRIP